MSRRAGGVVVLLAALLGLIALTGLQGRLVAGVAEHGASLRPGECALIDPLPLTGQLSDIIRRPVPVATWTPCATSGAASIIGSAVGGALPADATRIGYLELGARCRPAVDNWLRDRLGDTTPWVVPGSTLAFRPLTEITASPAVLPDGSPTGVCYLRRSVGGDGPVVPVVVDLSRPGDALGYCTTSATQRTVVPCSEPHGAEFFADVLQMRTSLTVNARAADGCSAYLAVATGRPDPTFGGVLSVISDPLVSSAGRQSLCGVGVNRSGQALTGSLLDLGDRPPPLR